MWSSVFQESCKSSFTCSKRRLVSSAHIFFFRLGSWPPPYCLPVLSASKHSQLCAHKTHTHTRTHAVLVKCGEVTEGEEMPDVPDCVQQHSAGYSYTHTHTHTHAQLLSVQQSVMLCHTDREKSFCFT